MLLKCEHLQHSGAFKYRGATNAVQSLTDAEAANGVATHSSGNHGQALAMAAQVRGIPCHVVMPHNSVQIKLDAVYAQGATVSLCEPTMAAREAGLAHVLADTGATAVHPFSDPRVIAGQGTAVRELLADHPDIQIIGAEPQGACDAYDSLQRGERVTQHTPDTVCDGLRGTIGAINFALMRQHNVEVLLINDVEVVNAMRLVRNALNLVIEPSSATVIAALARYPESFQDRIVGVVLSGGNVDMVDHVGSVSSPPDRVG